MNKYDMKAIGNKRGKEGPYIMVMNAMFIIIEYLK